MYYDFDWLKKKLVSIKTTSYALYCHNGPLICNLFLPFQNVFYQVCCYYCILNKTSHYEKEECPGVGGGGLPYETDGDACWKF